VNRKSGTIQNLYAVEWGGGQFVAVGDSGTILTSNDGITWANQSSGTSQYLVDIVWGGNKFVAIGGEGTILYSPDGKKWTKNRFNAPRYLYSIAWGDNQFAIVGNLGSIISSLDGINWTKRLSGTTYPLNSIAWGNNQFVAQGEYGTILTSSSITSVLQPQQTQKAISQNRCIINGRTLSYSLPYASPVSIKLFDIRGQIVQTLVNSNQSAGNHSFQVSSTIAQGWYLLSLRAGEVKVDRGIYIGK
jgi:hypothetical protein